MTKSHGCIVIVDPYSSGSMLAEALLERGAECVAIESSSTLPPAMKSRFDPTRFLDVIQHELDFEDTLSAVKAYQPTHVIAGFESGVELAERLSSTLSLPGNGAALRSARRDKFLMTEAAKHHGLRTAWQLTSNQVEEMVDGVRRALDWPVIVKPPQSVASDCVFCCHSADELRHAAETILTQTNVLGVSNPSVLVQEFLDGVEYAIDTVSCAGVRKLTAIWQYHRPAKTRDFVCYDAMTLLPYQGKIQESLRGFTFQVLDALEIAFGPAHCELMWVDGEPVLIEVGARLTSGSNATLSRTCGGICQLDETVEAILAPDRFLATQSDQPRLKKRAANVFLIPRQRGRLQYTRGLDEIQRLPTLYSMSVSDRPGDELRHVAGLVTLVDEDMEAIQRDIDVIRALEEVGIFQVEGEV